MRRCVICGRIMWWWQSQALPRHLAWCKYDLSDDLAELLGHTRCRDIWERAQGQELTASEALFGFMGWLTARSEVSGPFSRIHEAGPAADLVSEFLKANRLTLPREGWTEKLVHPDKPEGAQA